MQAPSVSSSIDSSRSRPTHAVGRPSKGRAASTHGSSARSSNTSTPLVVRGVTRKRASGNPAVTSSSQISALPFAVARSMLPARSTASPRHKPSCRTPPPVATTSVAAIATSRWSRQPTEYTSLDGKI